jgi:hypothetical protein
MWDYSNNLPRHTLVSSWLCLTHLTHRLMGAPEFTSQWDYTIHDRPAAQTHGRTRVPLCVQVKIVGLPLIPIVIISPERQPTSCQRDHSPYREALVQLGEILTTPQKLAWEVRDFSIFKLVQHSPTSNVGLFQHFIPGGRCDRIGCPAQPIGS